jgi:hypothetical protein
VVFFVEDKIGAMPSQTLPISSNERFVHQQQINRGR